LKGARGMAEIKACPFCGGEAELDGKSDKKNYQVWCPLCSTIQMGEFYDTPEEAISAWNRRAYE
jgi:hypothetical protein